MLTMLDLWNENAVNDLESPVFAELVCHAYLFELLIENEQYLMESDLALMAELLYYKKFMLGFDEEIEGPHQNISALVCLYKLAHYRELMKFFPNKGPLRLHMELWQLAYYICERESSYEEVLFNTQFWIGELSEQDSSVNVEKSKARETINKMLTRLDGFWMSANVYKNIDCLYLFAMRRMLGEEKEKIVHRLFRETRHVSSVVKLELQRD